MLRTGAIGRIRKAVAGLLVLAMFALSAAPAMAMAPLVADHHAAHDCGLPGGDARLHRRSRPARPRATGWRPPRRPARAGLLHSPPMPHAARRAPRRGGPAVAVAGSVRPLGLPGEAARGHRHRTRPAAAARGRLIERRPRPSRAGRPTSRASTSDTPFHGHRDTAGPNARRSRGERQDRHHVHDHHEPHGAAAAFAAPFPPRRDGRRSRSLPPRRGRPSRRTTPPASRRSPPRGSPRSRTRRSGPTATTWPACARTTRAPCP